MKDKKKIIYTILICAILILGVIGCGTTQNKGNTLDDKNQTKENSKGENDMITNNKGLVLYFSATGNTKKVATTIKNVTNYDIKEIVPKVEYTKDDLNYNNNNSRANREQNDKNARPEIESVSNINEYDVIYLGYPIWWGEIPKVVLTLLDTYDFKGKTIVPFCTSGLSGISQSTNTLKSLYKDIKWVDGKRFEADVSENDIKNWIDSLNINSNKQNEKLYIKINGNKFSVTLENNSSVNALIEKLKEKDITINMHDYGNFEKVGDLGFNLPRNDKEITTTPGDVILYQGNSITIYYETNNWNFTKLGHIDNITQSELKKILGDGNVIVTFSLTK